MDGLLQMLSQLLGSGDPGGMPPPAFAGAEVPSEDAALYGKNTAPGAATPSAGKPPGLDRWLPAPQHRPLINVPGTTVDADGQSGLPEKLKAMLSGVTSPGTGLPTNLPSPPGGGQMAPSSAPARPPLQRPPATMPPPRAAPPAPAPGEEPAAFFRRLFAGAASVNPTSPKMSAFAQGGAGAMLTQQAEKERAQKMDAAKGRQSFADTLALRRDKRAENADVRADGRATRAAAGSGGEKFAYEVKRKAWLAVYPGDEKGALEHAGGQRKMSPQERRKAAISIANTEAKESPSDAQKAKTTARAAEIERILNEGFDAPKVGPAAPDAPGQPKVPGSIAPPKPGAIMEYKGKKYRRNEDDPGNPNSWQLVE